VTGVSRIPHVATGRGFTLFEVIVAVTVMMVSLVAVSSLGLGTIRWNAHGHRMTAATNLARDKIEALRRTTYSTVTSGADPSPLNEKGGTGTTDAIYHRSWAVSDGPTPTTRKVVVTVTWGSSSTERVKLQTLLGS
jgi:Tfp pilus assembly protein PilV